MYSKKKFCTEVNVQNHNAPSKKTQYICNKKEDFFILQINQQKHNYNKFINDHAPTCFDTRVIFRQLIFVTLSGYISTSIAALVKTTYINKIFKTLKLYNVK